MFQTIWKNLINYKKKLGEFDKQNDVMSQCPAAMRLRAGCCPSLDTWAIWSTQIALFPQSLEGSLNPSSR